MQQIKPEKNFDFLSGGGEMGERIRNFDWIKTPLGEPEYWEQSLKTCVRIMLSSSQPIWIGWGEELIKLYNDAYIDIVRGKHPRALGQPASVVWKDIWKDIEPLLSKAMTKDEGSYVESQLLIMERSGFPEETYYTFSYTPVLGEDGKPAGIICYNTADTERIINERSLQTLRQLNILAQKKTEEEVFAQAIKALETNKKDFPFAILYKIENEATTAKAVASTGIDLGVSDLPAEINLNDEDAKTTNFKKAVSENTIIESENNGRWKNLPKGAWDVAANCFVHVPIKAANKKFPLAVLTFGLNPYRKFDNVYKNFVQLITDQISLGINNAIAYEQERKRAEALAEIDRAKTLFFTNISHEFRTPLTLMLGPLEELMNNHQTHFSDSEKQSIETTHRNAVRLLKLVNTLLDFSRIESGRQKANYTLVDIVAFTKNLASNFRSIIEKAGLQLLIKADEAIPPVYVDKEMWEKIVFNLLSNAFKYTLEGSITIELSSDKKHAILKVKDTGVGIPEKELPHMFERFHRVQNITGRTYEGTGIGLSLVHEMVQLHGGNITVESREQKGTTFTVIIPSGKEHLPSSQIKNSETNIEDVISNVYIEEANALLESVSAKNKSNGKNIALHPKDATERDVVMIIDDNTDMRTYIETLLSAKFQTVTAVNGMDALQKLKTIRPALILSDVMMPVMDGIELLKEIKNNKSTSQIPVILLSARAGEESKIEGYEIGADDYLVKPFSAKELIARVRSQIEIAAKLKSHTEQLTDFFENATVMLHWVDAEGKIIWANKAEMETLGYTKEEYIGQPIKKFHANEKTINDILHRLLNLDTLHDYPSQLICKDGSIKNVLISSNVFTKNGKVVHTRCFTRDITDQVIATKKIEESEKRFRALVTATSDVVYRMSPDWNIMRELKGQGFLSDTGEPIDNWLEKYIHPKDKERVMQVINKAIEEKSVFELEHQVLRVDGSLGWTFSRAIPILDDSGEIVEWFGAASDITERKAMEQAMRENEKQLQKSETQLRQLAESLDQKVKERTKALQERNQFVETIFNSSIDIMSVLDKDLNYVSVNKAAYEMFRMKKEDILGKNLINFFPPAEHAEIYSNIQQAFKGELVHKIKYWSHSLNRWFENFYVPLKNDVDEVYSILVIGHDITDAIKASETIQEKNKELERSNKELESFNYVASHDLQEPLRKIQTFIAFIEKSKNGDAVLEKYLNKISASAERMSKLIQSVLDYSRLSQNNDTFQETDLNEILENVKSDYELLIAEKEAIIKTDKLPVIKAIPLQMQQLFSNLISNSLKFSKAKPLITISSTIITRDKKQKFAEIKFNDNGIGFEPQYSEQIFKLFQRLHSKVEYSGTGVGLSIVSKIIEKHNGFIKAESDGNGAIFTVWLPMEK